MQPKIHCRVAGKLFAAVIERQNTDISFIFNETLAGLTLDSGATFSVLVVPAIKCLVQTCRCTIIQV